MMNVRELREHWLSDKEAREQIVRRFMAKAEDGNFTPEAERDFLIKFIADDNRTIRWFIDNTLRVLEEHEQRFADKVRPLDGGAR